MNFYESIKLHTGKRRLYDIMFFAFLSFFITSLENMFPRPIPYFRIGFAFIIIITILNIFTLKELILLIFIKNMSVALLFAYIFTPPFYLGLSGGIVSVIIMKSMSRFNKLFSLLGLSILGAVGNNITQLFVSKYLFKLHDISFLIMPVLIISLITGSVVGILALLFYESK